MLFMVLEEKVGALWASMLFMEIQEKSEGPGIVPCSIEKGLSL